VSIVLALSFGTFGRALQNHPWANQVNMDFIPRFDIALNFCWLVSIVLALSFVVLTSLTCLDKLFHVARQGLPMEMLFDGLDGSSFAGMS
jgi:hypothetical protein